jgi:hypothetical protein
MICKNILQDYGICNFRLLNIEMFKLMTDL